MMIDPAAVLAVISEQATQIAALETENAQLRAAAQAQQGNTA